MTIVVEDGTGKSNAVSYASASDADTYWAAESDETWSSFSTAEKESALVRATRELDRLYSVRFVGVRASSTQSLCWPREQAATVDGIAIVAAVPRQVIDATIELARTATTEDLRATDNPLDVTAETVKVGPIELSTDYASWRVDARARISTILAPVIGGPSVIRVRRS